MSSNGYIPFHPSHQIWFACRFLNFDIIILKIGNTESGSKVIAKCDRSLLQSAPGITKCGRSLLQSMSGITKCDRLLLQSASGITKCDSYYEVRRNNNAFI